MPNRHRAIRCLGLILLAAALVLTGCLPFPLGDPAKSKVDPALSGQWLFDQPEEGLFVTLYPFDEHAYVLEYLEYKRQDGELAVKQHQVWKAWLTDVKGTTFLTVDVLAQRLPGGDGEKPVYPVSKLTKKDAGMQMQLVNEDYEGFKEAKSSADVAAVIERELNNPKLYRDDVSTYRKLDATADKELLEKFSKLLHR